MARNDDMKWFLGFCGDRNITPDLSTWEAIENHFRRPKPDALDPTLMATMAQNVADWIAGLADTTPIPPSMSTLVAKHGPGLDPNDRRAQSAMRKLLKGSDALSSVPAVKQHFVKGRLAHDTTIN